jgi:hypothetical protein
LQSRVEEKSWATRHAVPNATPLPGAAASSARVYSWRGVRKSPIGPSSTITPRRITVTPDLACDMQVVRDEQNADFQAPHSDLPGDEDSRDKINRQLTTKVILKKSLPTTDKRLYREFPLLYSTILASVQKI